MKMAKNVADLAARLAAAETHYAYETAILQCLCKPCIDDGSS